MKTTIQGTGYAPFTIEHEHVFESVQSVEPKRSVIVRLFDANPPVITVEYRTAWESERCFTTVFCENTFVVTTAAVREASGEVLPPGAGYPATEQFAQRQERLRGQLSTLTLVGLSDVLKQAQEAT